MTDDTTKPKRKPAGAALPGYVERPKNYPARLNTLVQQEIHDRATAEAERRKGAGEEDATFSSVIREWLYRGAGLID